MANNELPNGFILKLRQHCGLGAKGTLISTHKTLDDAEAKAKTTGYALECFVINDIYTDRTYTTRPV